MRSELFNPIKERDRIIQPSKGCISLRGLKLLGEIPSLLNGCLKDPIAKMRVCHVKAFNW